MVIMKKVIFLVVVTLVLSAALCTTDFEDVKEIEEEGDEDDFHLENKHSCQDEPTICYVKGSPGPYCCKVCVDILTDRRHCGSCKHRCKEREFCCSGKCTPVSPSGCDSLKLAM